MQAKDLDDRRVLALVGRLNSEAFALVPNGSGWAFTWDIFPALPEAHPKVVVAKLKALVRRGLLDGCPCGCRGDFVVTDAGRAFIQAKTPAEPTTGHDLP